MGIPIFSNGSLINELRESNMGSKVLSTKENSWYRCSQKCKEWITEQHHFNSPNLHLGNLRMEEGTKDKNVLGENELYKDSIQATIMEWNEWWGSVFAIDECIVSHIYISGMGEKTQYLIQARGNNANM